MNFSTASNVSFVYNIYLVASVIVCVCFVCYYNHCCIFKQLLFPNYTQPHTIQTITHKVHPPAAQGGSRNDSELHER